MIWSIVREHRHCWTWTDRRVVRAGGDARGVLRVGVESHARDVRAGGRGRRGGGRAGGGHDLDGGQPRPLPYLPAARRRRAVDRRPPVRVQARRRGGGRDGREGHDLRGATQIRLRRHAVDVRGRAPDGGQGGGWLCERDARPLLRCVDDPYAVSFVRTWSARHAGGVLQGTRLRSCGVHHARAPRRDDRPHEPARARRLVRLHPGSPCKGPRGLFRRELLRHDARRAPQP